jgi:acylaminoacyl-peptidase
LTGEADYRTPISESQQYYLALKLRKIDAAMVRMPGASRDRRPSESSSAQGCLHLEVA